MAGKNASNYQVGVRLGLDLTPYSSGLKAAGYEMLRYQRVVTRANRVIGGSWTTMATVTKGVIASIAAAGVAILGYAKFVSTSTKEYSKFEDELLKSLAIFGDISDVMQNELSDAAREVGTSFRLSAEDGAKGLFFLKSAGFSAEQSLSALGTVAQFAQAGMFGMGEATSLLTDAQSALGLKFAAIVPRMEAMVRVSDVLVGANTLADATTREFALALTNHAANAMRELNIPMEQGVALLAVFADRGIKGQRAGLAFANVLRDLQRAATINADEFDRLGLTVFNSSGNIRDIADIFEDLENLLGPLSDEQVKLTLTMLGFQERSQKYIKAALGASDSIRQFTGELYEMGGISQEVSDNQLVSLAARTQLMKDAFRDARIEVGEHFAPVLRDELLPFLTDVAEAMGRGAEESGEWSARFVRGMVRMADAATLLIEGAKGIGKGANTVGEQFAYMNFIYGHGIDELDQSGLVLRAVLEGLPDLTETVIVGTGRGAFSYQVEDETKQLEFWTDAYAEVLSRLDLTAGDRQSLLRHLLKAPNIPDSVGDFIRRQLALIAAGLAEFDSGDAQELERIYGAVSSGVGELAESTEEARLKTERELDALIDGYREAAESMGKSFEAAPEPVEKSLEEVYQIVKANTIKTKIFMDNINILYAAGMDNLATTLYNGGLKNAGLATEAVANLGLAGEIESVMDETDYNAYLGTEAMKETIIAGFDNATLVYNRAAQFGRDIAQRINVAFATNIGFSIPIPELGGMLNKPPSSLPSTFKPSPYSGGFGLASGGIVTGPMQALIGEAGSPEAVIPLNGQGATFLAKTLATAIDSLGGTLGSSAGSGSSTTIVLPAKADEMTVINALRLDRMRSRLTGAA